MEISAQKQNPLSQMITAILSAAHYLSNHLGKALLYIASSLGISYLEIPATVDFFEQTLPAIRWCGALFSAIIGALTIIGFIIKQVKQFKKKNKAKKRTISRIDRIKKGNI